jgi:hypothetical protein
MLPLCDCLNAHFLMLSIMELFAQCRCTYDVAASVAGRVFIYLTQGILQTVDAVSFPARGLSCHVAAACGLIPLIHCCLNISPCKISADNFMLPSDVMFCTWPSLLISPSPTLHPIA